MKNLLKLFEIDIDDKQSLLIKDIRIDKKLDKYLNIYAVYEILFNDVVDKDFLEKIKFKIKNYTMKKIPELTGVLFELEYINFNNLEAYYLSYLKHILINENLDYNFYELEYDFNKVKNIFMYRLDSVTYSHLDKKIAEKIEKSFLENYNINLHILISEDPSKKNIIEIQKEKSILEREKITFNETINYTVESKPTRSRKSSFNSKNLIYKISKIQDIPIDKMGIEINENNIENKSPNLYEIEGEISDIEIKKLKQIYNLIQFTISDETDSIVCKKFLNEKELEFANTLKEGDYLNVKGKANYDEYLKDVSLMLNHFTSIEKHEEHKREDLSDEKRVELHVQTKLSPMDGISEISDYVKTAKRWGHKAIALTDRNGLYAYPDFAKACKQNDIKPIYGLSIPFVDEDTFKITTGESDQNLNDLTYVVFDLETTSLSLERAKIIEFGAVKIKNGIIIDEFQEFVDPKEKLTEFTKELTHITDDMLDGKDTIDKVLPRFLQFSKDCVLVAHNAAFDVCQIKDKAKELNIKLENILSIDTLDLMRYYYSDKLKRFNLKAMSKFFNVELENHHRAIEDAKATAEAFKKILIDLNEQFNCNNFNDINKNVLHEEKYLHMLPNDIDLLVKNQTGYRNLFKIISDSLTTHFHNTPRLTKKVLLENKEGILIGATGSSLVFETALNRNQEELEEVLKLYDYCLVYPLDAYSHILKEYLNNDTEVLKNTIKKIIYTAKKLNILPIASSNPHYIDKNQQLLYKIFIRTPQVGGGRHELAKYNTCPDYYFKTTDELLRDFSFLNDKDLIKEIVITNSNKINDLVDNIKAFPDDLYSFKDDAFKESLGVNSIEEELKRIVYSNLEDIYGKNPHPIIIDRLNKELNSIISNKFSPIYYISHLLVKKSNDDGYVVGSRGSVGSSFIATLMNITEVNPLPPHYYCKNGCIQIFKMDLNLIEKYGISEDEEKFQEYLKKVGSGFDLDDAYCPKCNSLLKKDGHDIPFETFLGFKGDKVPDIDLNFSGDYQNTAHEYVKELVGEKYAYRAGTVLTVAKENSFGYVKGYFEDNNIPIRKAQITRISKEVQGIKKTTGKHAGGIIVVPKNHDIFDVTPYQYPADKNDSTWYTTHFDYHSFEANLLKLDILGHDDPTVFKFIMDYVLKNKDKFPFTNVKDIPYDDKKVYELFQTCKGIGLTPNKDIYGTIAAYAIPEFGTTTSMNMLEEIKPKNFAELVKVSGLAHGKDVWQNNGQVLFQGKGEEKIKLPFEKLIGCRDDIMVTLMNDYQLSAIDAFDITETVRKGKQFSNKEKWEKYRNLMLEKGVPSWYIRSLELIKYMFPKAHATAYVLSAIRISWFKIHHPLLFYSAYFSTRSTQFDYEVLINGKIAVKNKIQEINDESQKNKTQVSAKDQELLNMLNVALEMLARGYRFLPVDVNKSRAQVFEIDETQNGLRLPFVTIDGLGILSAINTEIERDNRPFTSVKDLKERSKFNKTVISKLESYGILDNLKEEDVE